MYSWALVTGDAPTTADAHRLRQAFGSFPTGVCLVTTISDEGKREGMTINSFASVSLDPPLILWSIRDDARSCDVFLVSRSFILSVLSSKQTDLAQHFARSAADKFEHYESYFEKGLGDCPKLRQSVATFECSVYSRYQEGDHTILVGKVEAYSHTPTAPLLFHSGKMGSLSDFVEIESSRQ